jgi:nitroimidazol reductase NimA-like FMN-containing flavoprotein (pyridoxamine 5'-phosphate oxidase superfamily)
VADQQPDEDDAGLRADAPRVDRPVAPTVYGFARATAPLLAWDVVEERLRYARNYWLATVRPDGRPHVTPVWGVWVEHALWVNGFPTSQWARNLMANPAVAVHLESADAVVIVEGTVEDIVTDEEVGGRVMAAWDAKYGRLHPEPATDGILRLKPRSVRAWTDAVSFSDATRWTWG